MNEKTVLLKALEDIQKNACSKGGDWASRRAEEALKEEFDAKH